MSEMIHKDPVRIFCKHCGSPAGFDILHQTYRCPHCGRESGIQEAKKDVLHWRELQKQNSMKPAEREQFEECTCPSCRAHVIFPEGEVSVTCDFCGSRLVHDSFSDEGQMPDLIIPFFITKEEARKRMLDWGHQHENTPEGRSIVSGMGNFKGYYLPYYLVYRPVYGTVTREGTDRTDCCIKRA